MAWVVEVEHPHDADDRRDAEYRCDTWAEAVERWEDLTGDRRQESEEAIDRVMGEVSVESVDPETGRIVSAREVD